MSSILQQILNGLTQGCTYSLIAIGYAMIFGALRKMNWSHSDVFAAGSMCTYFFLGLLIPQLSQSLYPTAGRSAVRCPQQRRRGLGH